MSELIPVEGLISVIVPTVDGREDHLARCIEAYGETCPSAEVIVIRNKPTCGEAWLRGAEAAHGEFLHFTADDLVPHEGWAQEALRTVRAGLGPAPVIYTHDGSFESSGGSTELLNDGQSAIYSAIPFFSREQWQRMDVPEVLGELHYWSDNLLSDLAWAAKIPVVVRRRYLFTHHWALPGRGAGMTESGRMAHDRVLYQQLAKEMRGSRR